MLTSGLRLLYRLQWMLRSWGLRLWSVRARQTQDGLGVLLPCGNYVAYGKPYHWRYFLGRIK